MIHFSINLQNFSTILLLNYLFIYSIFDFINFKKCCRRRFENFAQLVRDDAYALGCGMARLKIDGEFITLFTCNYSVGIVNGKPIYKTGKKGASGCKKGTNKDYKGLCSVKEIYNNPDYYKK